jgi:hypothetical protein
MLYMIIVIEDDILLVLYVSDYVERSTHKKRCAPYYPMGSSLMYQRLRRIGFNTIP